MSLARLRLSVQRLTCRTFASKSSRPPERSEPPVQEVTEKTQEDFLAMLSTPPDSQSSDYALEGGASALRKGRYPQAADDTLTRPLFPPGQSDQVYHLHVKSTSNNTIITLTDPQGGALKGGSASGGTVGFKGVGKSGYEAGYQCALRIFARIAELKRTVNRAHGDLKIELLLNGMFGQGREAMYRALMTQDGEHVRQIISRVTDTTRIRVGGTRPKKRRVL